MTPINGIQEFGQLGARDCFGDASIVPIAGDRLVLCHEPERQPRHGRTHASA
jgi:hypothetical protein